MERSNIYEENDLFFHFRFSVMSKFSSILRGFSGENENVSYFTELCGEQNKYKLQFFRTFDDLMDENKRTNADSVFNSVSADDGYFRLLVCDFHEKMDEFLLNELYLRRLALLQCPCWNEYLVLIGDLNLFLDGKKLFLAGAQRDLIVENCLGYFRNVIIQFWKEKMGKLKNKLFPSFVFESKLFIEFWKFCFVDSHVLDFMIPFRTERTFKIFVDFFVIFLNSFLNFSRKRAKKSVSSDLTKLGKILTHDIDLKPLERNTICRVHNEIVTPFFVQKRPNKKNVIVPL